MTSHQEVWSRMRWPVIGVVLIIAVIATVIAVDFNNQEGWVVDLVQRWQTLISGFLALVAAAFTAQFIALQIASTESMERKRFEDAAREKQLSEERSHMAARSVLPLTLNSLSDYSKDIARAAMAVLDQTTSPRIEAEQISAIPYLPVTPREVIADLQDFIRTAPIEVGRQVANLLSDLQLLNANAESTWQRAFLPEGGEVVVRANFEALVGRAVVIHARISGLYPYARRETEIVAPPSHDSVATTLRLWLVAPEAYPGYVQAAEAYLRAATPNS